MREYQENKVKKIIKLYVAAVCIFTTLSSFAQSYDFNQGYIFEQKYVKRIPLKKAEKIVESPGIFNEFLTAEWGSEKINNAQIERDGDRLKIKFKNKPTLTLRDFSVETTKTVEGDSQLFRYLKSMPKYLIVGVLLVMTNRLFCLLRNLVVASIL